jgi:ubiquitin-conjugating enzyme E2 W
LPPPDKELSDINLRGTPAGITLIRANDLQEWIMGVECLGESLYKGQKFALRFRFDSKYPIDSPQVGCQILS